MKKIFILSFVFLMLSSSSFATSAIAENNGRYVIYQHPQYRADQYLLDTQTGKVWLLFSNENGNNYFGEIERVDGYKKIGNKYKVTIEPEIYELFLENGYSKESVDKSLARYRELGYSEVEILNKLNKKVEKLINKKIESLQSNPSKK